MATDDEIIEMYIQDDPMLSVTHICNSLEIGPNSLYRVLRAADIKLRREQGITSRSQGKGSVLGNYNEEIRETVRMLHYVQRMPMTTISIKLSMPYDHVRALITELKIKDAESINEVNHDDVLESFKSGASMETLRTDFHLSATQLLIILDGGTVKQQMSDWGRDEGIVERILERVRAELEMNNTQKTLPL